MLRTEVIQPYQALVHSDSKFLTTVTKWPESLTSVQTLLSHPWANSSRKILFHSYCFISQRHLHHTVNVQRTKWALIIKLVSLYTKSACPLLFASCQNCQSVCLSTTFRFLQRLSVIFGFCQDCLLFLTSFQDFHLWKMAYCRHCLCNSASCQESQQEAESRRVSAGSLLSCSAVSAERKWLPTVCNRTSFRGGNNSASRGTPIQGPYISRPVFNLLSYQGSWVFMGITD